LKIGELIIMLKQEMRCVYDEELKYQYYVIDILKYIFCIGIVALHTGFLKCLGQYSYWIEKGLIRIGVPFFFMASGFMLERKTLGEGIETKQIYLGWSKRLFLLLGVFEVINIILYSVYYKLIGNGIIKIFLQNIRSIIFYPRGALWYLQACLVGVWVIYFFQKKGKQSWIIPVGILLYSFALICNSYNFLIYDSTIGKMVDFLLFIISSARNGLFYGFLFIYLGMMAFRIRCWLDNKRYGNYFFFALLVFTYFIFYLEIIFLYDKELRDDGSLFIFLPLFTILLLIFAAHFTSTSKRFVLLRNLSTGIYLIHYPILMCCRIMIRICHVYIGYGFIFITVIISAHIICLVAYAKNGRTAKLLR